MKFIESPNKHVGRKGPIKYVVLHTTESSEVSTGAEGVAKNWFAKPEARASAHFVVDNDSVVQCVKVSDTAWAAPGANATGIQIEMVGRAGQGEAGWSDDFSKAMLANAAKLVYDLCVEHNVPVRLLTKKALKDGRENGIITHAMVSDVFKKSSHTDPGKTFPMDLFMTMVLSHGVNDDGDEVVRVDVVDEPVVPVVVPVKADVKPEVKPEVKPVKVSDVPKYPGSLRIGHRGEGVADLQQLLNKKLGLSLKVDGIYGPLTSAAFKRWELSQGLGRNGILTREEWVLLHS